MLGRWIKFNSVGALGIVVQLLVLAALTSLLGMHYLLATGLAVESAVLHNFVWHERWTWSDRRTLDRSRLLGRLLRFNLTNGALSILGNLVFMRLLVESLGVHYLPANLVTIALCSVLNFLVSDRFVFGVPTLAPASTAFSGERGEAGIEQGGRQ